MDNVQLKPKAMWFAYDKETAALYGNGKTHEFKVKNNLKTKTFRVYQTNRSKEKLACLGVHELKLWCACTYATNGLIIKTELI